MSRPIQVVLWACEPNDSSVSNLSSLLFFWGISRSVYVESYRGVFRFQRGFKVELLRKQETLNQLSQEPMRDPLSQTIRRIPSGGKISSTIQRSLEEKPTPPPLFFRVLMMFYSLPFIQGFVVYVIRVIHYVSLMSNVLAFLCPSGGSFKFPCSVEVLFRKSSKKYLYKKKKKKNPPNNPKIS